MIEISIDPILFSIGSLEMGWHGLMVGLAVLVGLMVTVRLTRGSTVSAESIYSAALWGILGGVIGARVFHVVDHWDSIYSHDPAQMLYFWEGGLSLFGAIIGGFVFGAVYCMVRKLPMGRMADLAVPGVLLAQAVGRIGCLINGDAYGTVTSLPWGVFYTHPNAAATTVLWEPARHPTVAYEIIWDLLLFAVLFRLRKRLKKDWMLLLIYAPAYAIGRFFFSFMRGDEAAIVGPLHQSQIISLVLIAVTVPLFIWVSRRLAPGPALAASEAEELAPAEVTSMEDGEQAST
jgi:phosphatidylglycerol:prolipoprotein diacylglycerol transferase